VKRILWDVLRQDTSPDEAIRLVWDVIFLVTMLAVIVVLPIMLSFAVIDHGNRLDPWVVFLFTVDILFACDMYQQTRQSVKLDGGMEIVSRKALTWRYLKTWFIIDLLAILPFQDLGSMSSSWIVLLSSHKIGKGLRLIRYALPRSRRILAWTTVSICCGLWALLLLSSPALQACMPVPLVKCQRCIQGSANNSSCWSVQTQQDDWAFGTAGGPCFVTYAAYGWLSTSRASLGRVHIPLDRGA
jgi:hypothetical protein